MSFTDSFAQNNARDGLRVTVGNIHNGGQVNYSVNPRHVELSPSYRDIVFRFDAEGGTGRLYRYRLFGYDQQWKAEKSGGTATYIGLIPGEYILRIQQLSSSRNWSDTNVSITVTVKPDWWQTGWFRYTAALMLAILSFIGLKRREKLIHTKALEKARMEEMRSQALQYQLEIERVINYFAYSISGLNNVDDMLWDVVKTCISQLGFQDCVIYLFNKEKTMLIQKAAYGPKNIDYTDIYNRVQIEPGSGIVGHVAVTGVAEIIADTSHDSRYLIDDAMRLSEIAVPLISGEGIIGVIDSEHPDKDFYNNRHLQILTAIGNMVVNKIEQIEAIADSHNKEVEMARLQRDVATLQLTATRAQMNPHFIFNALNSIQQYILLGDSDEANRYLSRFSKLQREILTHCDKQFISLHKEIEMLNMYLQLEQLRFNGSFDFEINTQQEADDEEIRIPPMILQPFVENAIWHGLMPKQGHRKVSVNFNLDEDSDLLLCTIRDNGVGRKAAGEQKKNGKPAEMHESKGLSLVSRRLELLGEQLGRSFSSTITDLTNEEGEATGTMVEVLLYTGF